MSFCEYILYLFLMVQRGHPSGAANQATVLQQEGVTVSTGSLGELQVDFSQYGWFVRQLPSEAAEGLAPPGDNED
jgi:methylated-DNA-protein-cysteine methyltransferase-like protein